MKNVSVQFSGDSTSAGVDHIVNALNSVQTSPSLLVVAASCTHDLTLLQSALAQKFSCSIHGMTSCLGVMSDQGSTVGGAAGIGVFAICDDDGDFATAAERFENSALDSAKRATERALVLADREGEIPELIWVSSSPGNEEEILAGICEVVGPDVPIIGGSAADNTVEGNWSLFDRHEIFDNGVVLSVFFPTKQTADVFQNGYSPTEHSGVVTRSSGRRIFEIDGCPAADVLNEWTRGEVIPERFDEPTAILSESTLWPLGSVIQTKEDREDYILIHPSGVNPDRSIDVFANVHEGQRITQMNGTKDSLIARAGGVATLSRSALERDNTELSGALVVFCGGCMLAVQDRVDEVADAVSNALGGVPFLGVFTFGEQGRMQTGGNLHGNLMISCVAFGA